MEIRKLGPSDGCHGSISVELHSARPKGDHPVHHTVVSFAEFEEITVEFEFRVLLIEDLVLEVVHFPGEDRGHGVLRVRLGYVQNFTYFFNV